MHLKDPELRKRFKALPDATWHNAFAALRDIRGGRQKFKSLDEEVRWVRRWATVPDKTSVGKLPSIPKEFVDSAVSHLTELDKYPNDDAPSTDEDWRSFLDVVAIELGIEYAQFCVLGAPSTVDWNSPPETNGKSEAELAPPEPAGPAPTEKASSEELTGLLETLKATAASHLFTLEDARARVEDTRPITLDLQQLAESWNDALDRFAHALHGSPGDISGGIDVLTAEVERVHAEEQQHAQAQSRIDQLTRTIAEFEALSSNEVLWANTDFRSNVEQQIATARAELHELTGDANKPASPPLDEVEVEVDVAAPSDFRPEDAELDTPSVPQSSPQPESTQLAPQLPEPDQLPAPETDADASDTEPPAPMPAASKSVTGETSPTPVEPVPVVVRRAEPEDTSTDDHSLTGEPSTPPDLVTADLARLVSGNRWAAASAVAPATGIDPDLSQALSLCGEAFSLPITTTDPFEMLGRNALLISESFQSGRTETATLSFLAVLRTCLQYGQDHAWLLTEDSFDILPGEWREIGRTLRDAVMQGYRHKVQNPHRSGADVAPSVLKAEAEDLRETLPKRGNTYQRAQAVLRFMLSSNRALARALDAVVGWADGTSDLDLLRECRAELSDCDKVIDIHDAALNGNKKKSPIVAKARESLIARINEVGNLLDRAILVAGTEVRQGIKQTAPEKTRTALQALPTIELDGTITTAALERFRAWLETGDGPKADSIRSFTEHQYLSSLPATSASRGRQTGLPVPGPAAGTVLTSELLDPAPAETVFRTYLDSGNIAAARRVPGVDDELALRTAQRDWRDRLSVHVVDLQASLLRAQVAQPEVVPEVMATLDARITALSPVADDRYDMAELEARAIATELAESREAGRRELSERLQDLALQTRMDPDVQNRIESLLEQGDFVTAREFMALLTHSPNSALPPAEDSGLLALERFRTLVQSWPEGNNALEVARRHNENLPENVTTALQAWNQGTRARQHSEWVRLLGVILPHLGLEPSSGNAIVHKRPNRHPKNQQDKVGRFAVHATPVGGSYVAALGSSARRKGYSFYTVREESVDSAFDEVPIGERREANVFLYPGVLSWESRKKLRTVAEKKKVTALVIDTATMVHLALEPERTFRSLQRVTLPFSVYQHWAPRVASDVPDELFVGRDAEIDKIISREGSIFVYGGRQLGKSALLHRIERDFSRVHNHLAIYIDFRVERIGEENEPEYLWTVLRNRLQQLGVVSNRNSSTKPEAISKQIRDWLDADPERRILLLCDESDAFLQNEARERAMANRVSSFPNVEVLKGLMDATHRRFKPVFAGLHQVQRIADTPNTPLAHGGEDILVGPLGPQESWDLVVRPFKALGYKFETLDLVWRLLAFTNHHAGLVQFVCDELYKHMRSHPVASDAPPYTIRAADVDHVITSKTIRDFIAERFRLTIQLEDRYFVVAMVFALLGLDDGFRNQYTPRDILEQCRAYWNGGFDPLSEGDLVVYLNELEGLGILVSDSEQHYGLRSPNVVHMLGNRDWIENQLLSGRFELPLQYNAKNSRRRLSKVREQERYSPLSEFEFSKVMPKRGVRNAFTFAVVGSDALRIGAVQELLTSASKEGYDYGLEIVPADEANELARSGTGALATRPLVVCDAVETPGMLDTVAGKLLAAQRNRIGRRGVILGVHGAEIWRDLAAAGVEVVPLRPWTVETIRATIDNPITDPSQREEFIRACGGWPSLCEQHLDRIRAGVTVSDAIAAAEAFPQDGREASAFLSEVGLTLPGELAVLVGWATIAEDGDVVDHATISALLDIEENELSHLVDRLSLLSVLVEHSDGVTINSVVHRALLALGKNDA